ncbi:MAG: preprotein translocase subunit SecE [Silvanigrellaceae bacterium]|nr:preprotein translocase subunit SecE [Silvanigrellaceae bacterium]
MSESNQMKYRYAFVIYAVIASYFWYFFYSLSIFICKNYLSEGVTSVFSIQNSYFHSVMVSCATILTLAVMIPLFFYAKLKEFIIDVGDELSRVSWPELSEAQKKTGLVIILVIVSSIFLSIFDFVFLKIINIFLSTAS